MNHFQNTMTRLFNDEAGQDMIEYALIAGLISLAAVATFSTIGTKISTIFTNIQTQLTTAAGS
jgi:pilus assembly protein Flp/PilA